MAAPPTHASPAPPPSAAPAGPLAAILVGAFALQLWTAGRVHGYPLADSVEYLERARLFLDGAALDPDTVRSFAFSALLVPLVLVFRVFGDEAVLCAARLAVMALGLATLVVVARTAARLAGGGAGLVAAFALAANPVFLQWSVEPLSGTAAAFFVALAILLACERGGFRRGLAVGAALGAAFLMAFQSLAILACVGGVLALRDVRAGERGRRGRAHTAGWIVALGLFLALQATLDLAVYGAFGSSLVSYVKENFAPIAASFLIEVGGRESWLGARGLALYDWGVGAAGAARKTGGALASRQPRGWYLQHLQSHLYALPMLVLLAAGLARSIVKPRWTTAILVATCALNALAMSRKGAQSFRLWLPLLPMLSVLLALGWAALAAPNALHGRLRAPRRIAALLLLAAGAVQGVAILRGTNLAQHGGYWDAMDFVAGERERAGAGPERLGAGYHWATLFRDGGDGLAQVKLPHPLYAWPASEELRAPLRAAAIAELDTLDWFVAHLQLFEQDPGLAAALAARFEVAAAFHDGETYEDLATILVFRRVETGAEGARRLFEIRRDADPDRVQARLAHPRRIDLRREFDDGVTDRLVLLGWDAEVLPGSENVAWITLTWLAGPTHGRDYATSVRITDPDDRYRQLNRAPCWGAAPTSTWAAGSIVRDGMPIPLGAVPGPRLEQGAHGEHAEHGGLHPPLGGANRRGDLIPLRLWLATPRNEAGPDGVPRPVWGLTPYHPSGEAVRKERRGDRLVSDEGWVFSPDNLVLVGGFLAPVPAALRLPDDGRGS